jgi:hypothetical protein
MYYLNWLKAEIFITTGKRSVACGSNGNAQTCLKGRILVGWYCLSGSTGISHFTANCASLVCGYEN